MGRRLHLLVGFLLLSVSPALADKPPRPPTWIEPAIDLTLVELPGGCFTFGNPGKGRANEKPSRKACVDAFSIGRTEVTQGQWTKVMGSNPSVYDKGDDHPVEMVTWKDVQAFITRLNKLTGKAYRLPTEREWAYACRGGEAGHSHCGGDDYNKLAWHGKNSQHTTHRVARKRANAFGLHDMSGNVWEWTGVAYRPDHAPGTKPHPRKYAIRGGSWYFVPNVSRASYRDGESPERKHYDLGFRLAHDAE